jgi:hypothetical protein
MANAQTHEAVASELLAGQAIACCFVHLPSPGEILVGNPFLAEMAVSWASSEHISDQFQQLPSNRHDGLVAVHTFLHHLERENAECTPNTVGE